MSCLNLPNHILRKSNQEEITDYLSDASNYTGECESVYFPVSTEEVAVIVKAAVAGKIPVTTSATRTSLTGSSVPDTGIVINTSRMNQLLYFDKTKKTIELQPGFILKDLKDFLQKEGLLYPPDPTEELCTIGGNAATNASGAKSFKFGPTRNYIEELEIVLADGEILDLKREDIFARNDRVTLTARSGKKYDIPVNPTGMPATKNAAGYYIKENMDAIDLFIGCEGTLGIITKIKLKLLPAPESVLSCVAYFTSEQEALNFLTEARSLSYKSRTENLRNEIDARALEFFDGNSLQMLKEDFPGIPACSAAVWFEQEYSSMNADSVFSCWDKLMEKHKSLPDSWFASGDKEQKEIGRFRHAISYKVNEYIKRNRFKKVGTDVAVPDHHFEDFYRLIAHHIRQTGLNFATYGHFGNSHIHLNMLPRNEEEFALAKETYFYICREAVKLGGTVSAEHGIGKIKREYLKLMYDEEKINAMRAVKSALDPDNLLCRGNIFLM